MRGQLFKLPGTKRADDVFNGAGHSPEDPDAGSVKHHNRPCAHAARYHNIDLPALQCCNGVAGAVLVMAVCVINNLDSL